MILDSKIIIMNYFKINHHNKYKTTVKINKTVQQFIKTDIFDILLFTDNILF